MIENKLQTHSNKSKHMFIGSSYNLKNKITRKPILINNQPIPRTDSYSCLGVNVDERLSWEKHIDNICSKVGAGIGAMRRIKPFVPLPTLTMLYNAIVQPYFDYCSPLWDNCGIGMKNRLQKYQNRAARVITGANYDVRSADLLKNLRWEPLEVRRNYLKAIFMYKIINGHTAPNLKESFRSNNEIDNSYNLRNRETDLALPMPKKEFGKRCFNYNGASLWNNLPQEAKNSESLSSFKTILNQRIC